MRYGEINNDFLMVKGSIPGVKKRIMTLRKSLFTHTSRKALEKVELKWIDTSSEFGPRRLPDAPREEAVRGHAQEGPGCGRVRGCRMPSPMEAVVGRFYGLVSKGIREGLGVGVSISRLRLCILLPIVT